MESEAQPTSATSEVTASDLDQGAAASSSEALPGAEVGAGETGMPSAPAALREAEAERSVAPVAPVAPVLPVDPPGKARSRPASIPFLVVVTVVSLAADLVSKHYAKSRLSGLDLKTHALHRVEIWKGHVDFIFAQNPGGAWSFLRGLPDTLRRPFFLAVSAAAIVFIISIYRRIGDDQKAMKWGLPLALGGAMGNLVDRMRYGWVVDFVDIYVSRRGREHHWPTFNVADIAIVIGVGLMAIDMLWIRRTKPRSPDLTPHPSSP